MDAVNLRNLFAQLFQLLLRGDLHRYIENILPFILCKADSEGYNGNILIVDDAGNIGQNALDVYKRQGTHASGHT